MNLLKLRKEKNKSQQEIAELLGIRQTAYSKYENNLTEPSIENLIKLADYYQVSIRTTFEHSKNHYKIDN